MGGMGWGGGVEKPGSDSPNKYPHAFSKIKQKNNTMDHDPLT